VDQLQSRVSEHLLLAIGLVFVILNSEAVGSLKHGARGIGWLVHCTGWKVDQNIDPLS
jgi:hypothetical protein